MSLSFSVVSLPQNEIQIEYMENALSKIKDQKCILSEHKFSLLGREFFKYIDVFCSQYLIALG